MNDWAEAVWQHGPALQSQRMTLLALANFADESGWCSPAIDTLARMTCVSVRTVQRAIQALVTAGWISVEPGRGRGNTSAYCIAGGLVKGDNGDIKGDKDDTFYGDKRDVKGDICDVKGDKYDVKGDKYDLGKGDKRDIKGDKRDIKGDKDDTFSLISDGNIFNIYKYNKTNIKQTNKQTLSRPKRENSTEADASQIAHHAAELEICVGAWNEMAGKSGLAKVARLSPPRKSALMARLKDAGGVEAFCDVVRGIPASDFLTGKRPGSHWKATFDFVLQASSFLKLQEGQYGNRAAGVATPAVTPAELAQRRAFVEQLRREGVVA